MGKAKIVSGGKDGKYKIKLDFGTELRDERVAALDGRIAGAEPEIQKARAELQQAKAKEAQDKQATSDATDAYIEATKAVQPAYDEAQAAGKALEALYASSSPPTLKQVQDAKAAVAAADKAYKQAQDDVPKKMDAQVKASLELVEAKKKTMTAQIAFDLLNDELTQLKKTKASYAKLKLDEERTAWCADLIEDAEGEVATIEIPGESKLILIKAGAEKGDSVDGQLLARELQSPAQVFFNAAILPGWQKWKPTYRRGTITALDIEADTADVALEEETSTGQKLDINQTKTLEAVPVNYMGCNAEAFEVGDACVVRFDGMNWDTPKVMGFVASPKACPGGIGISTDTVTANDTLTDMAIYRPPTGPAQGQWTKRVAKELNGGVAYVAKGGTVLVESGAGLFRGNKRMAGPLHGAAITPQLRGSQSFPISGLFIGHDGVVRQAAASGDSLVINGREIKKLADGLMQSETYALPSVPTGYKWDMASASQDGGKISVCRIGEEQIADDAPPDIHVRAVAHYIETPGADGESALFELSSVQAFDRKVTKRIPDEAGAAGYAAPLWGEFSNTRDDNYDANRGTDNLSEYIEKSHFEADDIYRCYMGRSGEIFTDGINRINNLSIQVKNQLRDITTSPDSDWPNRNIVDGRRVLVNFINSEEVDFFGKNKVKTRSTKIDYKNINEHRGFADWWECVANVVQERVIESDISREINIILMADEDFHLVISIKAKLKYRYTYSGGLAPISASGGDNMAFYDVANAVIRRGDWANSPYIVFLPNVKTSEIDPIAVSLEVSGGVSYALDSGDFDSNNAKLKLEQLTNWMSDPLLSNNYAIINDDGQGNADGFIQRPEWRALEALLDAWVNEKLTDVLYAKDPKTGVGFLSFTWGDETKNYVVGPWGVEPSSTRTDVASDAKVTRVVSV